MVCTGNICRSPTMEGVLRSMAASRGWDTTVDSAGTEGWHAGEPPDPRTVEAALARGYRLDGLRARKVTLADFTDFDLILAADRGHLAKLRDLAPPRSRAKLRLFLGEADLADPYYGGPRDFEAVLDAVEARCRAWDGSLGFF
jgi:protein-tyrosine phosphatase